MNDLVEKMPRWLTPQMVLSGANFIAIVFAGGMVWSSTQGEIANNRKAIETMQADIRQLRQSDTSISVAVLKTDVQYIKDSLLRIEGRLEQRSPSTRP